MTGSKWRDRPETKSHLTNCADGSNKERILDSQPAAFEDFENACALLVPWAMLN